MRRIKCNKPPLLRPAAAVRCHRPPATRHRPPAPGHRPPAPRPPATGHRPPATGHRPPAGLPEHLNVNAPIYFYTYLFIPRPGSGSRPVPLPFCGGGLMVSWIQTVSPYSAAARGGAAARSDPFTPPVCSAELICI